MIRILATALLALSLTASGAFATSIDDLIWSGGGWCSGVAQKKFTSKPFSGRLREGPFQGRVKKGKCEGTMVAYYRTGQLRAEGQYRNGLKEGLWVLHWKNGDLRSKGAYKSGKMEGPWVMYDGDFVYDQRGRQTQRSGNGDKTGTYRNGVRVSD